MIPMKKVARNWSLGLALLIAPSAWADNKPKSSPAPKAAAHPAAKANSRTAAAGHFRPFMNMQRPHLTRRAMP